MMASSCSNICILVSLATLVAGCGIEQKSKESHAQGQNISSENEADLGTIRIDSAHQIVKHEFQLKNLTETAIELGDFKKSCACLRVESPRRVLAGESFSVALEFDGRGIPEQRVETVVFQTNNSDIPFLKCSVTCITVPRAFCEPRTIYNVNLKPEEAGFSIEGVYSRIADPNEIDGLKEPGFSIPQGLEISLQQTRGLKLPGGVYAIRTPWKIQSSTLFSLGCGDSKTLQFSIGSTPETTIEVGVKVHRESNYKLSPKRIFVTSDDKPLIFSIESASVSDFVCLACNKEQFEPSDFTIRQVSENLVFELKPSAFKRLFESSGNSENRIEIVMKEGACSLSLIQF